MTRGKKRWFFPLSFFFHLFFYGISNKLT
jgi:hypothetical protein